MPQYQPSPSQWGTIGVVALCVLAVAAVAAVVVVLVRDARDDDDVATTGATTTVNANATTRSPSTSVLPSTSAAPVGGYGTTPCAPVMMKNWLPLVFTPESAIASEPTLYCPAFGNSSMN